MHAGLPILADNTGGPLETIVEGKTGWLRPSRDIHGWTDVIRRVLWETRSDELTEMARLGKERVEREFSLNAMGDRLEGEIGEMLNGEGRAFMSLQTALLALSLLVGLVASGLVGLAWKV